MYRRSFWIRYGLALGGWWLSRLWCVFVPPGSTPRIHIWAEAEEEIVRVQIRDNGIGIAPEYQKRIFGIFERVHPSETYPGTGIGLAIVQKGMERLGGRVGVESKLGAGCRFWLELKLVPQAIKSVDNSAARQESLRTILDNLRRTLCLTQ